MKNNQRQSAGAATDLFWGVPPSRLISCIIFGSRNCTVKLMSLCRLCQWLNSPTLSHHALYGLQIQTKVVWIRAYTQWKLNLKERVEKFEIQYRCSLKRDWNKSLEVFWLRAVKWKGHECRGRYGFSMFHTLIVYAASFNQDHTEMLYMTFFRRGLAIAKTWHGRGEGPPL